MKSLISNVFFLSSLVITLIFITGCPPEKTTTRALAPSICISDSIRITPSASASGRENNWIVNVNIMVKCGTTPLANTEIKLTYTGDDYIYQTDAAGNFSRRFGPATGNPRGNRVGISVMGSDGNEVKLTAVVQ